MLTRLFLLTFTLLGTVARAQGSEPEIPSFDPDGKKAKVTDKLEQGEWESSGALVSAATPEFTPPILDSLAAFLTVSEKNPTATFSLQPFRILPLGVRPLWGLQTSVTNDTSTKNIALNATYQITFRWLFPDIYKRRVKTAFDKLVASEASKGPNERLNPEAFDKSLFESVELDWFNIIRPSFGVQQTYFNVDQLNAENRLSASRVYTGTLSLRFGPYLDAMISYGQGFQRASASAPTKVSIDTFSATALFNRPMLLKRDFYDKDYLATGHQVGIAIGATYTSKRCLEEGETKLACLDAILNDQTLAAIIEFRLAPKLNPRIQIGRRDIEKVIGGGAPQKVSGLDAALLFAFSINP